MPLTPTQQQLLGEMLSALIRRSDRHPGYQQALADPIQRARLDRVVRDLNREEREAA